MLGHRRVISTSQNKQAEIRLSLLSLIAIGWAVASPLFAGSFNESGEDC